MPSHLLSYVFTVAEERSHRMKVAVVQSITSKLVIARHALKLKHTRKQLPKKIFPRELLSPETDHELVELEVFVCDVLHLNAALSVGEKLSLFTNLPLALAHGEKLVAVDTAM